MPPFLLLEAAKLGWVVEITGKTGERYTAWDNMTFHMK
jgi:hypothetical protein